MHTAAERYRLAFSWVVGLLLVFLIIFSQSVYEESAAYEVLELVGYGLIVVATLGRIWATVYIGGRKDTELCQDGPYSLSRNPLYLFTLCGVIGVLLGAQKPALILIIIPFFFYYYSVIRGEEKRLLQFFGSTYADYCHRVSRIWPTGFRHYTSPESFTVYPKVLFRSMVHASLFMWIFMGLEFLEYFREKTQLIPTLLHLPF
jgi:protein-S-isoprenylcysteine O-methyltransferase Ste14